MHSKAGQGISKKKCIPGLPELFPRDTVLCRRQIVAILS